MFASLRDPKRLYHVLAQQADTSSFALNVPDIRDGDGTLVHPRDYESKLVDGAAVAAEVVLKV